MGLLHQNCVRAPFGCRSGVPFQRRLTPIPCLFLNRKDPAQYRRGMSSP